MKKAGIVLLLLLLLGGGGLAWWAHGRLTRPYRGFSAAEVFVDLPAGTRQIEIGRRLAEAGVVPDAWTFRLAVRLAQADRRLRAGEYRFAEAASPFAVVSRLVRGDVFTYGLTFREGLTLYEMSTVFERSGLGTAAAFETAAKNAALIRALDPDASSLEGYLFPSTYAMPRHAGAAGTVRAMVTQFEHVFDAKHRDAAAALAMPVRDVVTLASIVEKETAQPAERPIVAAVYRNRLKIHMPLQCDPTVIYALMLAGQWNGNLTHDNMQIDSPYNTYRYAGLPPGPIASPGRASLDAALHPADVPYLYFVSRNDGTHVFAATLAEHNKNVAAFQKHR